jgi:hypothetical protein
MITAAQCAAFAGLAQNEIILGATSSRKHEALLLSYLLNLHRGPVAVREMIVSDLRGFLDLGARDCAADTLLVLRLFLYEYPEAKRDPRPTNGADIIPFTSEHRCGSRLVAHSRDVKDHDFERRTERVRAAMRQQRTARETSRRS